jgi:hypothetical protein
MEDERTILEYGRPEQSSSSRMMLTFARHTAMGAVVLVLGGLVQLIHVTWYVGHLGRHPKWIFEVDAYGIDIGPYDDWFVIGAFPALLLKLAIVLVPLWACYKIWHRRRRSAAAKPAAAVDGPAS